MFGFYALSEAPFSSLVGGFKDASANVDAVSSVSASAIYLGAASATSATTSTVASSANYSAGGRVDIQAVSNATAYAVSVFSTIIVIFPESTVSANGVAVYLASANSSTLSSVTASGRRKWEDEADIAETWTAITDVSESWTDVSEQSETWTTVN